MKASVLEFSCGPKSGRQVEISDASGDGFTIGSAENASLRLDDGLVSPMHAAIRVREFSEAWIRDLGSRIGTKVNGERLKSRERLLRDGDMIQIGAAELEFLDGSVPHTGRRVWRMARMALMAAIPIAAGVAVWDSFREGAATYRALAEDAASRGEFDEALKLVDEAFSARNAEADMAQNEALASAIRLWRRTRDQWSKARSLMAEGKLAEGRRVLLDALGRRAGWTWNSTDAAGDRSSAEFAETTLRLLGDSHSDLKAAISGERGRDDVKVRIGSIGAFLDANCVRFRDAPYLDPATNRLHSVMRRLESLELAFAELEDVLSEIGGTDPDFAHAASEMARMSADGTLPSGVGARALQMVPALESLASEREFIDGARRRISDLDFEGLLGDARLRPFPDASLCALSPMLSDAREAALKERESILRDANALAPAARGLEAVASGAGFNPAEEILDHGVWLKALSFDSLERPVPSSSRTSPCGAYDALLGIESVFSALKSLPSPSRGGGSGALGFTPLFAAAIEAYSRMDSFVRISSRPGMEAYGGRLSQLRGRCIELSAGRDGLSRWLSEEASQLRASGKLRESVVAALYSELLKPEPSKENLLAIEEDFRSIERRISQLKDEYDMESDPRRRMEIRERILREGIPGNPILRIFWAEANDA